MHYFSNKFSKIAKRWALTAPQRSFVFNMGDLNLGDLTKLWFFKLIVMKSNFKNHLWRHFLDFIAIPSPKWRH